MSLTTFRNALAGFQSRPAVCLVCNTPLGEHDTCWGCEDLALEEAEYLASVECQCGQTKEAGEIECLTCIRAMEAHAARDFDEEERQERLLKRLPDDDYTASEMAEYLL